MIDHVKVKLTDLYVLLVEIELIYYIFIGCGHIASPDDNFLGRLPDPEEVDFIYNEGLAFSVVAMGRPDIEVARFITEFDKSILFKRRMIKSLSIIHVKQTARFLCWAFLSEVDIKHVLIIECL